MPKIRIMAIYKQCRDSVEHAKWMQSLGLKFARYKNDTEWTDVITLANIHAAQAACQLCFIIKGDNQHSAIINNHKHYNKPQFQLTHYSAKYKLQNL